MLKAQGYIVLTAENGYRAVEIINDFPGVIDLALCDIRMPGPSGVELRNIILTVRPATKVALLSGDTSFDGIAAEVPKFAKPFTLEQFSKFVQEILA